MRRSNKTQRNKGDGPAAALRRRSMISPYVGVRMTQRRELEGWIIYLVWEVF